MPWEVARRGPCWRCSPPRAGLRWRRTASSRRCGTTNRPRTPRPTSPRWSAGCRRAVGPDLVVGLPGAYVLGGGVVAWTSMRRRQWCAQAAGRTAAGEHALAETAAAAAQDVLGAGPALPDDGRRRLGPRGATRGRRAAARRDRTSGWPRSWRSTRRGRCRWRRPAWRRDPYDERAVRDLMRALAGRRTGHGCAGGVRRTGADAARGPRHRAGQRLGRAAARRPARPGAAEGGPGRPAGSRPARVPGRSWAGTDSSASFATRGAPWWPATPADLALVVGEGGIGKTRLLDAVAEGCCRHRGPGAARPVPPGGAVAVPPALRGRAAPRASPRCHGTLLVARAPRPRGRLGARCCPTSARSCATRRRRPPIVDLQRRATYDAVLVALRRLAARRPVVLVVDDLQDAGAATLDLLGLPLAAPGRRAGPPGRRRPQRGSRRRRAPGRPGAPRPGRSARPRRRRVALGRRRPVRAQQPGHGPHGRPHARASWSACGRSPTATPGCRPRCRPPWLTRVDRLGAEARSVVEAGAVLRRRLDPRLLAGLATVGDERHPPRGRARSRRTLRPERCGLRVRERPLPGVRVRRASRRRSPPPTAPGPRTSPVTGPR